MKDFYKKNEWLAYISTLHTPMTSFMEANFILKTAHIIYLSYEVQ